MTQKSQHVSPKIDGTWAVRTNGALRAFKVFASQDKALSFAKSRSKGAIYIHGKDGLVVRKVSPAPASRTSG